MVTSESARCGEVAANPETEWIEWVVVGAGALLSVLYFLWFIFCGAQASIYHLSKAQRKKWANMMMSKASHNINGEIMVVQVILELSFSSIAILVSVITAVDVSCSLRLMDNRDPILRHFDTSINPYYKVTAIGGLLLVSFAFAFLSLQALNDLTVIVTMTSTPLESEAVKEAAVLTTRSQTLYAFSLRFMLLAIAASLWVFGPTWFLIGNILMNVYMAYIDRLTPKMKSRQDAASPVVLNSSETSQVDLLRDNMARGSTS